VFVIPRPLLNTRTDKFQEGWYGKRVIFDWQVHPSDEILGPA
jgi:hypothetical protein